MDSPQNLKAKFPQNTVLPDDTGRGSVTVRIPCFRLSDVIRGASDAPHPAFVVGERVLDAICISKFQNMVLDGRAYSLPDMDPATGIDYDTAVRVCAEKGVGWHLMTAMEWGAIALWCLKNGWLPYGNNDLGKDIREERVTARIAYRDEEKGICRTATGTGPVEWSHDRMADGICDLNANVWEWSGGIRLVRGELQLLRDASVTDASADSDAWRAIDGRTGAWIVPDGRGTTAHSIKLDFPGGVWTYVTGEVTDPLPKARFCPFSEVRADASVSEKARETLFALAILPWRQGSEFDGVDFYANNGASERIPFRGGRWGQGRNAGVFKTCIDDPRTYAGPAVGFRAAYYEA